MKEEQKENWPNNTSNSGESKHVNHYSCGAKQENDKETNDLRINLIFKTEMKQY